MERGVSVIIPTNNRDDLLIRAVESICSQSADRPVEIIVADNSGRSRLDAWLAMGGISASFPVRLLQAVDIVGPSHPRNVGASQARYEYLGFLDDDAAAAPDWLQQLTSFFDAHAEVAILAGRVEASRKDHPLEHSRQFLYDSRHARYATTECTASIAARFGCQMPSEYFLADYFTGSNAACRAAIFARLSGFDTRIRHGQDHDLAIRCWQLGFPVAYVPSLRVFHEHGRSYRRFLAQTYQHGISATERVIELEREREFWAEFAREFGQLASAASAWVRAVRINPGNHMRSTRTIMLTAAFIHLAGTLAWGARHLIRFSGTFGRGDKS